MIFLKGDDLMDHVKALAVKLISCFILLYIILGLFYDMSFRNVLWITLVLGITSYIIGDLLILPRTNNLISTLVDFVWAFLVIWIMGDYLTFGDDIITMSLISAAGVAIFEYFYHKYVTTHITRSENNNKPRNLQYQTEVADELTPRRAELNAKNDDKTK